MSKQSLAAIKAWRTIRANNKKRNVKNLATKAWKTRRKALK